MPGSEVKNWDTYHALRQRGYSKHSAAAIANEQDAERKRRLRRKLRARLKRKARAK